MPVWKPRRLILVLIVISVLWVIFRSAPHRSGANSESNARVTFLAGILSLTSEKDAFVPLPFAGYLNSGLKPDAPCRSARIKTTLAVQKSRDLYDNLTQVAESVESHELVVDAYRAAESKSEFEKKQQRESWARLSGSAVWLPDQQVYLVVTRVIFYAHNNLAYPFMSWLRGQVYDEEWNHLENYTIRWKDRVFTFPTVFDVPTDYAKGGVFYGPEDPRVVIEEGVKDAEPVIVFNMLTKRYQWTRAMYIYRPFSGHGALLTIRNTDVAESEKNWAPFFITAAPNKDSRISQQPSQHLHFVHTFEPLTILRCDLVSGICEAIFHKISDDRGSPIRGGTNWVPVPIDTGYREAQVWASFPRTMVADVCGERFYRPEFALMIKIQTQFYIIFVSGPMDFGGADIITIEPGKDDPCEKGRVLTPNSIPRWDTTPDRPDEDILTVTVSVNDATVQIVRVRGLLGLIRKMPILQYLRKTNYAYDVGLANALHRRSMHLLQCVVESARVHADDTRLLPSRQTFRDQESTQGERVEVIANKGTRIQSKREREAAPLLLPVEEDGLQDSPI